MYFYIVMTREDIKGLCTFLCNESDYFLSDLWSDEEGLTVLGGLACIFFMLSLANNLYKSLYNKDIIK